MSNCTEYYLEIQLYVDGELAKEDRDNLLLHLNDCAECRQLLEETETYSSRIRSSRPSISAPDSLRTAVLKTIQEAHNTKGQVAASPKANVRFWPLAAVAAALLITVGMFGFYGRLKNNTDLMIQTAVLAHQQLEQNALPLDVTSDSPQVVSSWFTSRVSFPFRMADSGRAAEDKAKYKLIGGRLLTVGNDRTALLSFRQTDEVVSLLITPAHLLTASGSTITQADGIAFHSHDRGPLHIVTWKNRGLSYVLTSTKSMSNTRKCSACHEERLSDKEINRDTTRLRPVYRQTLDESMVASAEGPTSSMITP